MKTVLKYPGAKNRLADWIVSYIPKHKVYLEPYFGSGAVFFNKEPVKIETINDLNHDVYNYFKIVREKPNDLIRLLENTPYSREEYHQAYAKEQGISELERARRFCVKCYMGFGASNKYKNGFRSSQQENSPKTTEGWLQLPAVLTEANHRLKHAQIENLPAEELIKRYNTKDVFIYCDPPYLPNTRKGYLYEEEMTEGEHIALLELLKEHPGKVLISGYENKLYNSHLKDWNKTMKRTTAENGLARTEVLWMNYDVTHQITLNI